MVGFANNTPKRPPLQSEIASIAPDRDITRSWIGELLEFDDPISLPHYDRFELFNRVATDVQVAALMQQRRSAIIRHRWEVEPGASPGSDPSRQDKKAADFIRALLSAMPFDRLTGEMHWGTWFGYAVAELNYAGDGAQVILDPTIQSDGIYQGLKVRDRSRFRFHRDGSLRLLTPANQWTGEVLPPGKFWTFTSGGTHSDHVGGLPLALLAFQYVLFRREDWREWLRFLKKQAQGSPYGEFDQPEHAAKLNQVLTALRNGGSGSVPRGTILHELALPAGAAADFATVDERIDAALAKLILGQVGTSEGVAGQHRGEMQHDVRQDLVIADSDLICSSLNRGPVTWLTRWNFEGATPPTVYRKLEAAPDLEAESEQDARIWGLGYAPTLERIQEVYGEGYVGAGQDNDLPAIPEGRLPSVIQIAEKVSGGALSVEQGRQLLLHTLPGITPEIAERLIVEPPAEGSNDPEAAIAALLGEAESQEVQDAPATDQITDEDAALGAAAGEAEFAALVQELEAGWLEFAAKQKKCTKGWPCAGSCISRLKNCRSTVGKTGVSYAQWLVQQTGGSDPASPSAGGAAPQRQPLPTGTVLGRDWLTDEVLDKALRDLEDDDNRENLGKLRQFVALNGTQVISHPHNFREEYAASERKKIQKSLAEELRQPTTAAYTQLPRNNLAGYTAKEINHVVIHNLAIAGGEKSLQRDQLLKVLNDVSVYGERGFTVTAIGDPNNKFHDTLVSLVHEIGHQVHFGADSPKPPKGLTSLSAYGNANFYEFFAEHYVLYTLAPAQYKRTSPKAYAWIDGVVSNSLRRKRFD